MSNGHPDCATVFDFYPKRLRRQTNREVLSAPRRLEEGARCRGSLGIAGGKLIVADAVLIRAIEVEIEWDARLLRCAQERETDRRRIDGIRNPERPAVTVFGVNQPLVVLAADEIRQDFAIAPAFTARFADPCIVILGVAAVVELGVD